MKKYDIYLIWSKDCDGNILRYYGSTANFIKRKSEHKRNYERWIDAGRPINNYKKCSSVHIIDKGDWKMEKIDEVIGERWEARKKEGEYQKNNDCVNVRKELRTKKEHYNDNRYEIKRKNKQWVEANKDKVTKYKKQFYNDNKDKIYEYQKDYRLANKEKIYEYQKDYRLANKKELSEKKKEYYNLNKEVILERMKEKITCECGSELRKSDLAQHHKSKKHINFINSANND